MALFTILLLSTFPSLIFSLGTIIPLPKTNITLKGFTKLPFPPNVLSTGSISFKLRGDGPYAGHIRWQNSQVPETHQLFCGLRHYYTNKDKAFCDGSTSVNKTPICGFPTGSSFDYTGRLFSCDITTGVTVVGPFGGLAKTLVPTKNGVPYLFLLAMAAASNQNLYFTDASGVFNFTTGDEAIRTGDSTGRLLEYNPKTKKVTTLLANLGGALGVATAAYVLVSEFIAKRIKRYWLKGENAGNSEIFLNFTGRPNKIKRTMEGNFWVALNYPRPDTNTPKGVKFSPSGEILDIVDFSKEYYQNISAVAEQPGKLFLSGLFIPYVGQHELEYLYH